MPAWVTESIKPNANIIIYVWSISIHTWHRWHSASIVVNKVEDGDSCTAVNIINEFITYILMQKVSGEETFTEVLQKREQILLILKFRKCKQ